MNSIRISLVTMLVAAFALISFLAALNGYRSSVVETEKLMDSQLEHASAILQAAGSLGLTQEGATQDNSEFVFEVWLNGKMLKGSSSNPIYSIDTMAEGFRDANFAGYRWRTLTRRVGTNGWYVVAERADVRNSLAEKVALESIIPLLLWLPMSALLV